MSSHGICIALKYALKVHVDNQNNLLSFDHISHQSRGDETQLALK